MSGMEVTKRTLLSRNRVCGPAAPAPIRPGYTQRARDTALGQPDRPGRGLLQAALSLAIRPPGSTPLLSPSRRGACSASRFLLLSNRMHSRRRADRFPSKVRLGRGRFRATKLVELHLMRVSASGEGYSTGPPLPRYSVAADRPRRGRRPGRRWTGRRRTARRDRRWCAFPHARTRREMPFLRSYSSSCLRRSPGSRLYCKARRSLDPGPGTTATTPGAKRTFLR